MSERFVENRGSDFHGNARENLSAGRANTRAAE
jgi:hypothetical protein